MTQVKKEFELLYGERLHRLMLYGAQTRSDQTELVGIDLLVVLRGGVDAGREIARASSITSRLSLEHDVVISSTFIPLAAYESEQSPLMLIVRREGVVV